MNTSRPYALALLHLALLVGVAGGCGGDESGVFLSQPAEDLSGRWRAESALTLDECGELGPRIPIDFPLCFINQIDATLALTCAQDWCGDACIHATGVVLGDDVSLSSRRTVILGPDCTLSVAQVYQAIFSEGTVSGETILTVTPGEGCAGLVACDMKGLFVLRRFPPSLFPACLMICE